MKGSAWARDLEAPLAVQPLHFLGRIPPVICRCEYDLWESL